MSIDEIIDLARKIRDTLRDGFKRAAHYLRSLGLDLEMAWNGYLIDPPQ